MKNQPGLDPTDRRSAILAAALQCFNRHGIEATSISDIGACAAASVGSIYHHFASKEGIAVALLVEGLRSNAQLLERRLRDARTAHQGIITLVQSLIEWIRTNPEWARFIYTITSSRLAQGGSDRLKEVNAYHGKVMGDFFGPHIKAGAFRRLPEEVFPSLVVGPVHDYARRWLNGQVAGDIADHADLLANSAWNAVRSGRDALK